MVENSEVQRRKIVRYVVFFLQAKELYHVIVLRFWRSAMSDVRIKPPPSYPHHSMHSMTSNRSSTRLYHTLLWEAVPVHVHHNLAAQMKRFVYSNSLPTCIALHNGLLQLTVWVLQAEWQQILPCDYNYYTHKIAYMTSALSKICIMKCCKQLNMVSVHVCLNLWVL